MDNLQQKARSAAQVHKNRKCLGWTAKGETGRCCLEVTKGEYRKQEKKVLLQLES